MANRDICIADVFDNSPVTSFQIRVFVICIFVTLLEGFDLMVIGVALPKIAQFLKAAPSTLGLAVGAGQAGPLLGAAVLGMVADRLGRKRTLILATLIFACFTLLTTTVASTQQLALFRFLAGIGLGGVIPNAMAYGCEYAPSRLRSFFTTLMWGGMAVGTVLAGFAAAWLLPNHGWQLLFVVGGIPPLIVVILVALFLPESLAFLVRQGTDKSRIRQVVARIAPSLAADDEVQFYTREQKLAGVPVKHLFSEGRAFTTIALWVLFFFGFYLMWVMLAWTPMLLRQNGATLQQASMAFAYLNIGSIVSSVIVGRLMDKFNPFNLLAGTFFMAFVTVGIFGMLVKGSFTVLAIEAVVTGLFIFGSTGGLMALATISYPVSIRGSGVGWAYAIGKIGSMLGPVVGGILLSLNWGVSRICWVAGSSALFCTVSLMILRSHTVSAQSGVSSQPVTAAAANSSK